MGKKKWNKGDASEEAVEEALKELFQEGKIRGYIRALKGREIDSHGIDLIVFLKEELSLMFPIQVKSSTKGLAKHLNKHPLIRTVIVVRDLPKDKNHAAYKATIGNLKKEILVRIKDGINKLKNNP